MYAERAPCHFVHGRVSVCSGRDCHALVITEGVAWDSLAACWAAEAVVYNAIQKVRECARKGRVGVCVLRRCGGCRVVFCRVRVCWERGYTMINVWVK